MPAAEQSLAAKRLPRFEFELSLEPAEKGASVDFRWNVEGATSIALWKSALLADTVAPIDWRRIEELGEQVEWSGSRQEEIDETTAYYLLARGSWGVRGKRILARVEEGPAPLPTAPTSWVVQGPAAKQPVGGPSPVVLTKAGPPEIVFETSQRYLLPGDRGTLTWDISNMSCGAMWDYGEYVRLKADPSNISGTSWGSAGTWYSSPVMCTLPAHGSMELDSEPPDDNFHTRSLHAYIIDARSDAGESATKTVATYRLALPNFSGNYTALAGYRTREQAVKEAVRDIYKTLGGGCIYYDEDLDRSVPAFADGHIERRRFWGSLRQQLENLDLITFDCLDTTDDNKTWAHWDNYSNVIALWFSPKWEPTTGAILSEFVHKCGFNSSLLQWYPGPSGNPHGPIEKQVATVTHACYAEY